MERVGNLSRPVRTVQMRSARNTAQVLATIACAVAVPAHAAVELLVPAYFYPSSSGSEWSTLIAAAQAGTPIIAIMNPGSGAGFTPNSDYVTAVNALRAAGGKVLGYVPTGYGGIAVSPTSTCQPATGNTYTATDVLNCAARYKLWYSVDGVFLDELTNTPASAAPATFSYYQQIYSGLKGSNGFARQWTVIGNPGTESVADYFEDSGGPTADALVVFENNGAGYSGYVPAAWQASYPAASFAHLVHTEPSSANATQHVATTASRNARYIFATNDVLANPWDTLPPYFGSLAQAVRDFNATHAEPVCNLDLDGNGQVSPDSDGVLLLRSLLGFRGNALTAGALGIGATRTDANAIATLVATMSSNQVLDIDRDSAVPPASDGIMLLRMMLGMTGASVHTNALPASALRRTWPQLRMHVNAACAMNFTARSDVAAPPVTVAAVGDLAQCSGTPPVAPDSSRVAAVASSLGAGTPLLLPGDLAYNSGNADEFAQCYDPIWGGALKAASYPSPGNHEYVSPNAAPYYAYFGARAGDPAKGYYSTNFGAWHVIALNSNLPMNAGSAQDAWLRADLLANAGKRCKLAYWHHPRFSSSSGHGNDPLSADTWNTLYEFKVDLVLNGHDHTYERFAPQTPAQQADARGIRAFVIGTGGASPYGFSATPQANSAVRASGQFGLVRFDLRDGSYGWQFMPAAGSTLTDSGTASCNL